MSKANLEEVETSANVLSIISIVTYVAVIILGIIKVVAIFTHLCLQLRDEKLAREAAEKVKKEREARKAAAKKKSKKGKSKKSKKSTSKTSSTKSSKKSAVEKKKPQQKPDEKPPPKMLSSKVEKKTESVTVRSGKNSSGTPRKQNLSVIELHHQDSLLSISSSKQSSEISQSISGLDELIKEMAAKKEKSLPKSEKDYPEVSTPPQTNIDQLPGTPGAAESARKVADVSNPPPLMAAPKANTDSLMLPLSTPPLAPFSPSTPAPSAEPVQPTTGGPPLAGPLPPAPVGTLQQSLPTSSPPPYSTDVTTTWISSSSSGASKNKTEGVPSDPKV